MGSTARMRWFIRITFVLFVVACAWAANFHYGWLPRPTDEQRRALDVLHEPNPVLGERNAFAAWWFLPYDISVAELDRLLREDAAAFAAAGDDPVTPFASKSATAFPKLDVPATEERLCPTWSSGCLDRVASAAEQARTADARFAPFRARIESLASFDHVSYGFPASDRFVILPSDGIAEVALVHAALLAADGDADRALVEACRFGGTWRRFRAHTDLLIVDMVSVAFASAAAQLTGEIIAGAPGAAWPPECANAFAPLADEEIAVCAQMRWEFRYFEANLDRKPDGAGWGATLPSDAALRAMLAPRYAAACTARHDGSRRLRANAPLECGPRERMLAPVACIIAFGSDPDFSDYRDRVLDLDGRFATLRTAVWLREQAGDPGVAFANRPAPLRTPEHEVSIDVAAGTLTMTALDTAPPRRTWTIPFARVAAPPQG